MLTLMFGLGAAVAWAVHDLLVRHISQKMPVLPMILTVAAAGSAALMLPALFWGDWRAMTTAATGLSMLAGLTYIVGMLGLYLAFQLAPVRIVAPVLGAFPMISLGIAMAQGQSVTLLEWLAVLAIVSGIAIVALSGPADGADPSFRLRPALVWAAFGAMGFAFTFALAQQSVRHGAALPGMLITRLVALVGLTLIAAVARAPMRKAKGALPILAMMGVLDALALGLVTAAGRLPDPEYASVSSSLFGVLTILLAWQVLGEKVKALQWLGIAIVFGGVAVLSAQG